MGSNKAIAQNTLFLYFRMLCTMVVTLYTSRVILQVLGVDDYGIYQTVGGIVGFLSMISGALGAGTSRFLVFELGKRNRVKLARTFSTTLTVHVFLALVIVLISETIGLWFVYNKLVIPVDRMNAAIIVFHLSVLSSFFSITQVPYNASIIAHERMGFYAYMSIIEVSLKLAMVFLLSVVSVDKLEFYAILLFIVQVLIMFIYRFYCVKHFEETQFHIMIDRSIFKSVAAFSFWRLFSHIYMALNGQGVIILINMFFGPAVVASRTIALQVNIAANQFVSNFQMAVSPQVIKKYAAGKYNESMRLHLDATCYSFFLMYLLSLPILLLSEPLLKIWLGMVPDYAVIFLRLAIIESLFCVFDTSFFMALNAKGQMKENAFLTPLAGLICFAITYISFRIGCPPVAASWASLGFGVSLGFVIKPVLMYKIMRYPVREIMGVFKVCLRIVIFSAPVIVLLDYLLRMNFNIYIHFVATVIFSVSISSFVIYRYGMEKEMRVKVRQLVKDRCRSLKRRLTR